MEEEIKTIVEPLKKFHGEEWHTPRGRAIREVVFGMNDGLITTIGFVAGVTGSIAQIKLVMLVGLAEALAGAISMAFGAYISTKAQREFFMREIEREKKEIEEIPETEKEEIRQIYSSYGFKPDEIEIIVKRISSDKKVWLKMMLREELGIFDEDFDSPYKNGAIMGISFVLGSIPPLLPYMFFHQTKPALTTAIIFSFVALFGIGVGKTFLTKVNWFKSGLEIMVLGSLAAAVGYLGGLIAFRLI